MGRILSASTKSKQFGLFLVAIITLVVLAGEKRRDWYWTQMFGARAPVFDFATDADSPLLKELFVQKARSKPHLPVRATQGEVLSLAGDLSINRQKWRYSRDKADKAGKLAPRAVLRIDILRQTPAAPGYISVQQSLAQIKRGTAGNNWQVQIGAPEIVGEYMIFAQLMPLDSMDDVTWTQFHVLDDFVFSRKLVVIRAPAAVAD